MRFFDFFSGSRPALIEQSMQAMVGMLETSERMFDAATSCLLDNEPLTVDLSAMDGEVNRAEEAVRRKVLEHLVVDPRDELTLSLIMVSVVQDAERCGDLAKSIARAAALADAPRMGRHVDALRDMRDRVHQSYEEARAAFRNADAGAANRVMHRHDALKHEVAGFLEHLAEADDVTPNAALVLGVTSRMIARTSSHLSNIVSSVALPFDQIRNAPDLDE